MTFDEYLVRVMLALDTHPEWRVGQAFFNVLADVRADISESAIRGDVLLDPFHRDERIPAFLSEVYKRW